MKRFKRERQWNKKSFRRRSSTSASAQTPEPRPEGDVFADLAVLCAKPGYVHALAFIVYQDSIITGKETFTKEDFLRIYSPKRLIRTEISVLIGLMWKSEISLEIPPSTIMQSMIDDTHRLMDELHQSILAPARAEFIASWAAMQSGNEYTNPLRSGTSLREAMFYGAESAFTSQYIDFSRARYAADDDWLIRNRGFTIAQAADITATMVKLLSERMMPQLKAMMHKHPSTWTMLNLFCFTADDIVAGTDLPKEVIDRFLEAYSRTAPADNVEFVDATASNMARIFPFIKLPDDRYTSFLEYNTSESLYDNAFYWMITDKEYAGTAANNRGAFTENLCLEFLERVMPENALYRNITFRAKRGKAETEADAIIFYGRRVFVFQAKSKRLTATAKTGDDLAISRDFKSAIQSAYDQSITCIDAIRAGVPAYDALGNAIQLPDTAHVDEYFPVCITSEHYPALSFQVSQFLKLHDGDYRYPLILDIFTLDIITEFLNTTLFFTDYLAKRSGISDKITSSHEMVILSYHLKKNLYLPVQYNFLMIEDDFLVDLDLAVNVRRSGIPGIDTPPGILTRNLDNPLGVVFKQIEESNRPDVHQIGEFLLGLSGESFDSIGRFLKNVVRSTQLDGSGHDLTVPIDEDKSGITIHCNDLPVRDAAQMLRNHCELRKYAQKADRWFGLNLAPDGSIRLSMGLNFPWESNPALDNEVAELNVRAAGRWVGLEGERTSLSRNSPCPCGSGRKFKRCHGQKQRANH